MKPDGSVMDPTGAFVELGWKSRLNEIELGASIKIDEWIRAGLDRAKLKTAFETATDKGVLYGQLKEAHSIYMKRVVIRDFDNIPGVSRIPYGQGNINMPVPKTKIPASRFGVNDVRYDLPDYRNPTFTGTEELVELPSGSKIYRVTSANEWDKAGGYWTPSPPNGLADVIGGTAVMPEWNTFVKVYEYTVPPSGIKVWRGQTAAQHISGNPLLQSSSHSLIGGDIQIFINDFLRIDENRRALSSFTNQVIDVTSTYKNW